LSSQHDEDMVSLPFPNNTNNKISSCSDTLPQPRPPTNSEG
jgi:hypothetical protein